MGSLPAVVNNGIVVVAASIGITATVVEKVLIAMGKAQYASWMNVIGLSLMSISGVALVKTLIEICSKL